MEADSLLGEIELYMTGELGLGDRCGLTFAPGPLST